MEKKPPSSKELHKIKYKKEDDDCNIKERILIQEEEKDYTEILKEDIENLDKPLKIHKLNIIKAIYYKREKIKEFIKKRDKALKKKAEKELEREIEENYQIEMEIDENKERSKFSIKKFLRKKRFKKLTHVIKLKSDREKANKERAR